MHKISAMKNQKAIIVAVSFIVAFLLLLWGINFLKGKNLLTQQRRFYAVYNDANGLIPTNPVTINGMRVGLVDKVYFDPSYNGNVIVELLITDNIPIPKNSTAVITTPALLGAMSVSIVMGDSNLDANVGDTLLSSVSKGMIEEVGSQLMPLKEKIENVVASLDSVVHAVNNVLDTTTQQNVRESLAHLEVTIKNLEGVSKKLNTILAEEGDKVDTIMNNVTEITSKLAVVSDSLSKADIAATIRDIDSTVLELRNTISKINSGEGTVGRLVTEDSLYRHVDVTVERLNELIDNISKNPKSYFKFSVF